jgi:hypothetical protein
VLFWRWSLKNCLPGLTSNHCLPDLSHPSTYVSHWHPAKLNLYIFDRTGVWTQAFSLTKEVLTWATPAVHFVLIILQMQVSWTICPGWPQTVILQISVSQVARIIGMSHQPPATKNICNIN